MWTLLRCSFASFFEKKLEGQISHWYLKRRKGRERENVIGTMIEVCQDALAYERSAQHIPDPLVHSSFMISQS